MLLVFTLAIDITMLTRLQTPAHVHYSGYTMSQLKPLITMMFDCCQDARKHHGAVYEKYASPKYKKASTFVENEINKGFQLPSLNNQSLLRSSQLLDDDSRMVQPPHLTPIEA